MLWIEPDEGCSLRHKVWFECKLKHRREGNIPRVSPFSWHLPFPKRKGRILISMEETEGEFEPRPEYCVIDSKTHTPPFFLPPPLSILVLQTMSLLSQTPPCLTVWFPKSRRLGKKSEPADKHTASFTFLPSFIHSSWIFQATNRQDMKKLDTRHCAFFISIFKYNEVTTKSLMRWNNNFFRGSNNLGSWSMII